MKRVTYNRYGNSEELKIENTEKPVIKRRNSLLVKVEYSSLNAIDWKNRKGNFRMVSGWFKPRTKQGFDVVGIVEDKTSDVTDIEINDRIVVQLGNFTGGALSEYVVVSSKNVVKLPPELSVKEVAGLPMAGTTAWLALFKNGKLKEGDKVLINGGSSGVGHLAIQIARAYGAEVTSVSSTGNLELCKNLGADNVISYQEKDFLQIDGKYDIIFDVVFNASLKKARHMLKPGGVYIGTTPTLTMVKETLLSSQAKFVSVRPNKIVLSSLLKLMNEGKLKVNIDKVLKIDQIVEAHDYLEQSRTKGKLIIEV